MRVDCSERSDAQARTPSAWCFNLSASECGRFFSSSPDKLGKPQACVLRGGGWLKGPRCDFGAQCERFASNVTSIAPAVLESLPMGLRGRERDGVPVTALAGKWRIKLTGEGSSVSLWEKN